MSVALPTQERYSDPNIVTWKKWVRGLTNFLLASNITENARMKATLLHLAGADVNDIFDTLAKPDNTDTFEETVKKITDHLEPKQNTSFNRYKFRSAAQKEDESVRNYVIRLKKAAEMCRFNAYSVEQAIIEQVIVSCKSEKLREKLLEEGAGKEITLDEVVNTAGVFEETRQQMSEMTKPKEDNNLNVEDEYSIEEDLNFTRLRMKSPRSTSSSASSASRPTTSRTSTFNRSAQRNQNQCSHCGYSAHRTMDQCPAKGKTCSKCQKKNHFWSVCRAKESVGSVNQPNNQALNCAGTTENTDEYLFSATVASRKHSRITLNVEGHEVEMIVDSGSTTNVIDVNTYSEIRRHTQRNLPLVKSNAVIRSYGNSDPLPVLGYFCSSTSFRGRTHIMNFHVINKEKVGNLLSKEACIELGIITFNYLNSEEICANNLSEYDVLWDQYPELDNGIGKLKGVEVRLHVDKKIAPVQQIARRTPYPQRKILDADIDELEYNDIVEPVTHPTGWVSPVHLVEQNGKTRMTVDMRQANKAITRVKHPMPLLEDILYELNGAVLFSKLDLKKGYHQLVLDKESRDVTTFITHRGLYRYKRLFFGINSASELFQHTIRASLSLSALGVKTYQMT